MMRRLFIYLSAALILLSCAGSVYCQAEKTFKTKLSTVYYSNAEDIDAFLWRLGGGRFEFTISPKLASNRIDIIIDRVATILDMRPMDFTLNIYLREEPLSEDVVAHYDDSTKAIYVSVPYTSQSVFAHEVAHAIINQYFTPPTPSKMQDILTQYVDKYLWGDY